MYCKCKGLYWQLLMLRKIFTGNIWSLKTNKWMKKGLFIISILGILLLNSSVIQIEDTLRDLFNSGALPRIGNDVVYSLLILNKVKLYSILASGENTAYWKVRQLKGCPGSTKCRSWGSDLENHSKSTSRESKWKESDPKCLSSLKLLNHIPCNANYYVCWLFLNWAKAMWK